MPLVENHCFKKKAIESIHILEEEQILMGDRKRNNQKKRNQTSKEVYHLLFYSSSELIGSLKINGLLLKKTAVIHTYLIQETQIL